MRAILPSAAVCVVFVCAAGRPARAEDRTVFAYSDSQGRRGCFVHLAGADWLEITGTAEQFRFKQTTRTNGRVDLHDDARGGVDVRLLAGASQWKTTEQTAGKWAPLWDGKWTTEADLRPRFEKLALKPTAQGDRGTCSVFTVNSALEFADSVRRGQTTRFSPEFLNWSANQVTGLSRDGQFFHDCIAGFEKYGICSDVSLPYQTSFDKTLSPSNEALRQADEWRQAPGHLRVHWINPWQKKLGLNESQFQTIKGVLARGWPVATGSTHSRLVVGYRLDKKREGGGVFLTLDSALGRFDEVTFSFARKELNDVFWIEPTDGN